MTANIHFSGERTDANAPLSAFIEEAASAVKDIIDAKMGEQKRPPFGYVLIAIDLENKCNKNNDFHMALAHNSDREDAAYDLLYGVVDHKRQEEGRGTIHETEIKLESLKAALEAIMMITTIATRGGSISKVERDPTERRDNGAAASDEAHPT